MCDWTDQPNNDPKIKGDPFKTLYVGRLDFGATEQDLEREFGRFGPIEKVSRHCFYCWCLHPHLHCCLAVLRSLHPCSRCSLPFYHHVSCNSIAFIIFFARISVVTIIALAVFPIKLILTTTLLTFRHDHATNTLADSDRLQRECRRRRTNQEASPRLRLCRLRTREARWKKRLNVSAKLRANS